VGSIAALAAASLDELRALAGALSTAVWKFVRGGHAAWASCSWSVRRRSRRLRSALA
jgi:hypothetical protein